MGPMSSADPPFGPIPLPQGSMGMGGGSGMTPGPIMTGRNPYGPSGPPPPGLSSQIPSVTMSSSSMYAGGGGGSMSKPLNTVQLQQLSAQIKAYRLLARNVPLPEALISIVHGRKPTPAMIAQSQQQLASRVGMSQQSSMAGQASPYSSQLQTQRVGSTGNIASLSQTQATDSQTSSSSTLYPSSPSVSQGLSPGPAPHPKPPATSTPGAPNVTISTGGELPLSVKQAVSASQTTSQPPTSQQTSQPTTSTAPSSSSQQQRPQSQQQGKPSASVKHVKLAPVQKPQGIDPLVVMKEREMRQVVLF